MEKHEVVKIISQQTGISPQHCQMVLGALDKASERRSQGPVSGQVSKFSGLGEEVCQQVLHSLKEVVGQGIAQLGSPHSPDNSSP